MVQSRLPTLKRFSGYCSPAFPSIRILLHSCESFSKQTPACKGEKGAGEGERGGWMQTQPRLLPLSCSLSSSPSSHHRRCPLPCTYASHPLDQESSGIRVWSACTADLLCDLGQDPALSGPLEKMTLKVSPSRMHRLPRQTVSNEAVCVCVCVCVCARVHGCPQSSLPAASSQFPHL